MIKNLLISLFISTLVVSSSYAAGSSDSGSSKLKQNMIWLLHILKQQKTLKKKIS